MIADAVSAAGRGDWAACLSTLLTAWRPHRPPELAELVERVSARVAAPAVRPETKFIRARIATASDADVTPIVGTIVRQLRTFPAVIKLGVELARGREPDPRIATMLAAVAPFGELRSREDLEVVEALEVIDDPRYRHLIVAIAEALAPRRGRLVRRRPYIDAALGISAKINARRPAPSLTTATTAAIKAIDAALAFSSTAVIDRSSLLAAIYREPGNLAARLVYADALLDAGDVRGELITLQCSRGADASPSARERTLLKEHARIWLGPIEPLVLKKDLVYRHGFVAEVTLAATLYGRASVPPADEWHTIDRLDLGGCHGPDVARWLVSLPNLRHVTNCNGRTLAEVIAHGPVRWETLALCYLGPGFAKHLGDGRAALPHLRELAIGANELVEDTAAAIGTFELARLSLITWDLRQLQRALAIAQRSGIREIGIRSSSQPRHDSLLITGRHARVTTANGATYATAVVDALPAGTIRTFSGELPEPVVAALVDRGLVRADGAT